MAAAKQFICPTCGFSVTTPMGMDDLVAHVTTHKDKHHPDVKMTQEQFMARVKDVDVMGAAPMKKGGKGKIEQKEESEAWKAQENVGKRFRSDKP
jgi:hypothetical protein